MSLNFKEKRGLQKTVAEQQEVLRSGPGFAAKRSAQKAMGAAMARLTGDVAAVVENPHLAALRAILAGASDALGLQGLLDAIDAAVSGLHQAGELLGDAEDVADRAITHWAQLEAAQG
ncbi:MAG: hypothetical protein EOM21_21570 [Gammaproteobacteria bacterium]|nr:hypothetical protein [Gammaproteobacteria bacterium]